MPSITTSWARPIQSFEEIPYVFKEFVSPSELLPYIIYSPPDSWGKKQTNAKLTCVYQNQILVLEVIEKKVNAVCYLFKDINYIEQGAMLLYSWVRIHGFVNGKLVSSIVEYNSVVKDLFHPLVRAIRQICPVPGVVVEDLDLSKLEFLRKVNYKFFNYSQESIMHGEKLMGTIYQQEICKKILALFTQTVSLAHLTILTDKELIVIKEEELVGAKRKYQSKNGGVWVYIPLHKVLDITINSNERRNVVTLVIFVKQGEISLPYSSSRQSDLEVFITEFKAISKLDEGITVFKP